MELIGKHFIYKHAAGETLYVVSKPHRDSGYFECIAYKPISGSHHFIGSIQIFPTGYIKDRIFSF